MSCNESDAARNDLRTHRSLKHHRVPPEPFGYQKVEVACWVRANKQCAGPTWAGRTTHRPFLGHPRAPESAKSRPATKLETATGTQLISRGGGTAGQAAR